MSAIPAQGNVILHCRFPAPLRRRRFPNKTSPLLLLLFSLTDRLLARKCQTKQIEVTSPTHFYHRGEHLLSYGEFNKAQRENILEMKENYCRLQRRRVSICAKGRGRGSYCFFMFVLSSEFF